MAAAGRSAITSTRFWRSCRSIQRQKRAGGFLANDHRQQIYAKIRSLSRRHQLGQLTITKNGAGIAKQAGLAGFEMGCYQRRGKAIRLRIASCSASLKVSAINMGFTARPEKSRCRNRSGGIRTRRNFEERKWLPLVLPLGILLVLPLGIPAIGLPIWSAFAAWSAACAADWSAARAAQAQYLRNEHCAPVFRLRVDGGKFCQGKLIGCLTVYPITLWMLPQRPFLPLVRLALLGDGLGSSVTEGFMDYVPIDRRHHEKPEMLP